MPSDTFCRWLGYEQRKFDAGRHAEATSVNLSVLRHHWLRCESFFVGILPSWISPAKLMLIHALHAKLATGFEMTASELVSLPSRG